MKKLVLIMAGLLALTALKAQWVDDPAANTFIANASDDAGEIYLSTNPITGNTFIQWECFHSNGWSPTLQCINYQGKPMWGDDGIHIDGFEFASYSEGVSMTATADGGVVSCFADYDGYTYAVKLDEDGNFVWGEQGIRLFDGLGFSRTELVAGTDGGFWALGSDYDNSYLQYVNADGTLNPTNTISAEGYKCVFGQLTLGLNNNVFLTYERLGSGFYTHKEVRVVGFATDGTQISPDILLMSEQAFQSTYIHHVVPDGLGGGYVYIWHPGLGESFNVYVFHFDENGFSSIDDTNGVPVHSPDPSNFYYDAYATVDPVSHDLIIAYEQTDSYTQTQSSVYVNRITASGEKLWGDGLMVLEDIGRTYSSLFVDAFEDGSGFVLLYNLEGSSNPYHSTVEALGMDIQGNRLWSTTMSSNEYRRTMCENSTGFHYGQDIVIWTNAQTGGLYGQNIQPDGGMGVVTPIPPQCPGPESFEGLYVYDLETETYGVQLSWTTQYTENPDYYVLTRTNIETSVETTIEIEGDALSYFDVTGVGSYKYQLRAAMEECGLTLPATTPDNEDYLIVEVTGIEENTNDEIVTIVNIYTANGQSLQVKDLNELRTGLYILQGMTQDGRLVNQKVVVKR